jgi:hypothetical protein
MASGTPVPGNWTSRLAAAVAAVVRELAAELQGAPVVLLAVDCHPWHGALDLAVLTAEEADADELLMNPAEMAAWRYYHFTEGRASWSPAAALGREMREAYEAASDRQAAAEEFFRGCAVALTRPEAAAAIERLERDRRFRISVAHPDDGREFYPPGEPAR